MSGHEWLAVISVAGAALTMALGAIGAALGESRIGAAAMDALAAIVFFAVPVAGIRARGLRGYLLG